MKFRILNFVLLSLFSVSVMSEQFVDLTNEATAKEFLLNTTWTCYTLGSDQQSPIHWTFDSVEGLRVRGSLVISQNESCSSDSLIGILKGNLLTYYVPASIESCHRVNGIIAFYQDDNGVVTADGHYTFGGLAVPDKYTCQPNDS